MVTALLSTACEAEVSSGLNEAQAHEIVLALDEAGIAATRLPADGSGPEPRYRVTVPSGDLVAAVAVMRERELPRRSPDGFAELFGDTGLIPNPSEERARFAAAVGGELSRTLESMDGVAHARVHVALPEVNTRLLDGRSPGARASVLIEHRPGARPNEAEVRALVAGAVQDLAREDVAVVQRETRAIPTREPHLARVGPVAVSRGTAATLKGILAASFALNLLLVAALISLRRWPSNRRGPNAEALHASDR